MSDANVLDALDRQNSGHKRPALSNVIIYGRVRCIINRPSIVGTGIAESKGYFALLDAYALKCLGEDYFREESSYDVNSIYFTKGSIIIYIDDKKWVGEDVKVFGKSKSYGATIRRQESDNPYEGITAFMFGAPTQEGRKYIYPLVPNALVKLTSKDPDARGTVLEDFIVLLASKKGEIPYPETLSSLIPYTGTSVYEEIEVDKPLEGITSNAYIEPLNPNPEPPKKVEIVSSPSKGERIDISKIDMHLKFHLSGMNTSEYYDAFKDDIDNSSELRNVFAKNSLSELARATASFYNHKELRYNFISRVASRPSRRLGGLATITCKSYIDKFLDDCKEKSIESLDSKVILSEDKIISGIAKLKAGVAADSSLLYGDTGDVEIDYNPIILHFSSFALNVVGVCTGIGYSVLSKNLNYCRSNLGMSDTLWFTLLLECPYYLGLVGVGLSTVDCDTLYFSFGKVYGAEDLEDLNFKYRKYLVMLDTLASCSKGIYRRLDKRGQGANTFVKIGDYKNADCSYPSKNLEYIKNDGFVNRSDIKELLEILLDTDLTISREDRAKLSLSRWYSEEAFNELCDAGIINTLEGYCALERSIEQEFLIYSVFEKLGKTPTGISDSTIESVISEFEKDRGFKLEGLQREGIKLCKFRAGVLSGCAGSGKTTTSDCITEVLKTLSTDDKEVNIVYCTPTGKACRRLAEVVHSTVKTIHSQFGVGMDGSSYLKGVRRAGSTQGSSDNDGPSVIYILDEMAMCSTELMFNIAKNISDNDLIYFLGDVKQLPPIGGGCPFKILMNILPCVELGVSKRAAEGSLVNYNTSLINFLSEPYCEELLYDDKTFIAKQCSDIDIVNEVTNSFSRFLDGTMNGTKYSEDDIQVISGYQSKMKMSSTFKINKPIQELLRKDDKILYYKGRGVNGTDSEPFYMNDRVIYINRNSYDICRYIYDKGIFYKVATFGCVNGEMGKLVGVINSKSVVIDDTVNPEAGKGFYENVSEEELESILERYDSKKDDLRSDGSYNGDNEYFVIMKVYDSDLRKDVLVLLRGRGRYLGSDLCLTGKDLDNLGLAYALTCHKMQGSQSKVVIAVFESTGSPEFMNRNMINTMITRSQGIVCCVGSVLGADSALNKGRKCVSRTDCRDLLSVLSGDTSWVF